MGLQTESHATVMQVEAIAALCQSDDGYYVDGTFGRGGHSAEILKKLSNKGHLLAIDKDRTACDWGRLRFAGDHRIAIEQGSFGDLRLIVEQHQQLGCILGVLLDLGVSSPQLDNPDRGFSFLRDGPLDMRMNSDSGQNAADWLAVAPEDEIAMVLKNFGEEKYARRMARAIVTAREESPITRTLQLADIIASANPAWEKHKHPATRAFQAIRIYINQELEDLKRLLASILDILAVGGRLVVISFHSLEDRIVKRFVRGHSTPALPKGLPVPDSEIVRRIRPVGRLIKPSEEELRVNPRARSAVMRVAEKLS